MAASGNRIDDSSGFFRLITAAPRNRELTGAADLLSHYGLRDLHEKFCQKPLPVSVGESNYLRNVVGDIEIRKGEGMELGQLLGPDIEAAGLHIHPFDIDVLQQAFTLRESGPISLPEADRGIPTISGGKAKEELKDKDRKHKKHKKHKDRHKDKEKDRDKDKERHKDRDKDKDKEKSREKDKSKKRENGEDKKHHKKKRKHDADEEEGEGHKHKKKKHKHSSKAEVPEPLMTR